MMSSPPSQFNYPLPKVSITASQVGTRINVPLGGSFQQDIWVELNNESPYILSVFSSQGILLNSLQPQIVDIAQIPSGDSLFFIIPNLLIPQASPTSEIDINVYPFGRPSGAYPFPLGRQSAPTPGTAPNGFIALLNFNVASAVLVGLNVFNPSASTKKLQFYSAKVVLVAASSTPTFSWQFSAGADKALGTAVTPRPNNTLNPNSPATVTVCSSSFNIVSISGFPWEQVQLTAASTSIVTIYECCTFPDRKECPPGTNVFLLVSGLPATGGVGTLIQKWEEL